MTVKEILDYLLGEFPACMKYDWDNVGLLCGDENQSVRTVLVALDAIGDVCREAAGLGADLLVTHHPLIFKPCSNVTAADPVGRCIRTLVANDISAINLHTNLDCAPDGVNTVLANTLGLNDVQIIDPIGDAPDGRPYGLLRRGRVEPQSLERFMADVKNKLHTPTLRYVDGGKPVSLVAVGGGSCGDEYEAALAAGCDTLVTADVKYNQFLDARELGLNLIDAGHFYTENPVIYPLAQRLQENFPALTVHISGHQDCMKFF